jgi:hypothetical protein
VTFTVDLPHESDFGPPNQAVLAACDEALRPRRCALSTEQEPARVRVRWLTPLSAQIDEWDGQQWRSQTLLFTEQDKPSERFRAVGLLLAALASGTRASGASESESQRAEQPDASPSPASAEHRAKPNVALDLGALFLTGPGVAAEHWRSGLQATLGARLRGWPVGVRVQAFGAVAGTSEPSLDAAWLGAGAGPYGVYEPLGWLRLSAGVDLGCEWLFVTLHDSATTSRQSRAYVTVRPWAAGSLWLNRWLGLGLGAELYSTPGQELRVDGEVVGQNPRLGVLGRAGVEFRLSQ